MDKPLRAEYGGELRAEDFDGDLALVLQILGQVDGGHAAFAEVAFDLVAVREGGGEAFGVLGHRAKMWRVAGFGEVDALRREDGGTGVCRPRPSIGYLDWPR